MLPQSKEEWLEHHLNVLRNELPPLNNVDPRQVAAWQYIVAFINQFLRTRKNMSIEDLELVMLSYNKFITELEYERNK